MTEIKVVCYMYSYCVPLYSIVFLPSIWILLEKKVFVKNEWDWWLMMGWRCRRWQVFTSIMAGSLQLTKLLSLFLHRPAPVGGIPLLAQSAGCQEKKNCPEINFSPVGKKQSCGPSLPGFLCRLRLAVNNSWRVRRQRHRGALSLRGSNAGIWTDLHGPLRDENSQ